MINDHGERHHGVEAYIKNLGRDVCVNRSHLRHIYKLLQSLFEQITTGEAASNVAFEADKLEKSQREIEEWLEIDPVN